MCNRKAFTLIELIITVVFVTLMLGAIYLLYNTGFSVFHMQLNRSPIKGEVSRFFLNIGSELRQARSITSATQTLLEFTADSDANGVDETIRYTWSGTAGDPLNRVLVTPAPSYTTPVVNSVNTISFSYYDTNNNLMAFPVAASNVRRVVVDVTVLYKDETFRLRSSVKPRNL